MNVIAVIISIVSSITSGVVLYLIKRYFDNKEKRDRDAEATRHQTALLELRVLSALGKLTEANSIALRDGKTNGELKAALKEYSAVNSELYDFLLSQVANH